MAKNRFKVQQNLEGVRAQLKEAVNRVDALYENVNSTLEERREAENIVKDLKNRVQKYENDLKELDAEVEERLNTGFISISPLEFIPVINRQYRAIFHVTIT